MNKLIQKLQPKDLPASSGQYDSLKAFSSNRRQASYAMMLIAALVVVSCLFTYEVFRMQRTMFEIVVLANENINVWRRIEKLVSFEPIDRRDGSLNERMAIRIQNEVAEKLEESKGYETRIEQTMGNSKKFFFLLDERITGSLISQSKVPEAIREKVEQFSILPLELMPMGITTWDADLKIDFLSSNYLRPALDFVKQTTVVGERITQIAQYLLLFIVSGAPVTRCCCGSRAAVV